MVVDVPRKPSWLVTKAALLVCWLAAATPPTLAQEPKATSSVTPGCSVDLSRPGTMKDIVSNALILGVKRPEADVRAFLNGAKNYASGQELLQAAARHFEVNEAQMAT